MVDVDALHGIINRAYRESGGWTGEDKYIKGDRITVKGLHILLDHINTKGDCKLIVCERHDQNGAGMNTVVSVVCFGDV